MINCFWGYGVFGVFGCFGVLWFWGFGCLEVLGVFWGIWGCLGVMVKGLRVWVKGLGLGLRG